MLASNSTSRPRSIEELLGPQTMHRLDRLDLLSRKVFAGKLPGERRSKRRGQSIEFDDYRQYVSGDDLRHIDWNVYARLDRMFIKLFLEEEDLGLHLVVDCSASMDAGDPNKLIFCQKLAMALGYIGLVNNNRVAVTSFGGPRMERLGECRGRRNVQRLGQFLLEAPGEDSPNRSTAPGPGADFTSALRFIGHTAKGKGVLVIMSDFLLREGYEDGLRLLAGRKGWDVYCLQVLAPDEIDPSRAGAEAISGDVRLTDVETGADAEVTVTAALLEQYKKSLERYCNEIATFGAAREMTHALVRTDTEIETLLIDYLRKRGMLR